MKFKQLVLSKVPNGLVFVIGDPPPPFPKGYESKFDQGPYKEMLLMIAKFAHGVVVVPPMRQAMTRC